MRASNLILRSSVCGILAAAAASGAYAQEKTTTLEEIVVTAERRVESLQDVPLSITAFGSEKRDVVGILSIQDMAHFAPGVSYNTSTDRPSIRGVARQSNIFTLDSPVANYFDGVYTTSVQDASRRPIFIDRTEILRGPQGALSGRGSIAGAINTISKMPEDMFGGEARGFYGNYHNYGVETTLTGPLVGSLDGRLNLGHYRQDKGFFNNVATGGSEGDQPNNRDIVDGLLTAKFGDVVDFFFKVAVADYDESRRTTYSDAPYVAGVLGTPPTAAIGAYGLSSATLTPLASYGYFSAGSTQLSSFKQNPVLVTGDVHNFADDYKSRQKLDKHHNLTSQLTWHAPGVDIKWISGHQNYKYQQWTDNDATDVTSLTLPTGRVVNPGSINYYEENRKWWSNELTFTSTTEGAFDWIGGLYQSTEKFHQEPFTTIYPGYNELTNPFASIGTFLSALGIPGNSPTAPVVSNSAYPNTSVVSLIDGKTVSSAAFGQIDYKLTDAWKFTVGLRYNKDQKDATEAERAIANGLGSGLGNLLAGGQNTLPLPGGGSLPINFVPLADAPGHFVPLGPRAVDVTPRPTAGAALPAGIIADRGIDPVTGFRVRDMKNDWTAVTGNVGVEFKPREEDLVYLRIAKGYRPGGFNAGFISDPPMVDKEKETAYEAGYKTTLAGKVQLSAQVFYNDYRDVQLPLPTLGRCTNPADLSTCTSLNSFVNLPKAESKGFEFEGNWAATDNLNFFLTYGYLATKIKDGLVNGNGFSNTNDPAAILAHAKPYQAIPGQFDTNFTGLQRYTQNITGNQFANSPKHKAALNGNYTFNFSPGKLTLSSSYVYTSKAYSDVFESEPGIVPSFKTLEARILWTDAGNRYTVIAYGTNLTNAVAADATILSRVSTGATGPAGAAYFQTYDILEPRQYGVELQYRFGGAVK